MDRLLFGEETALHGIADRRVGHGLVLELAALASQEDRRIADLIGPDNPALDFDQRQRGRSPGAHGPHRGVGRFDAIENRRPQRFNVRIG